MATDHPVRLQYEEFPYPDWTTVRPDATLAGLVSPRSILVVGCGTGRDACSLALAFPAAAILAVDVSRPSLEYAAGRATTLGLAVTFHLCDLLDLRDGVGSFDLILAAGVLHHLEDPAAGLARLAALLEPDGAIALGLYSRLGREPVLRARARAADLGYRADRNGVRRFRRDAARILDADTYRALAAYPDLRYDAGVRDLIFPARETTFDLAEVDALAAGAGLVCDRVLVSPTTAAEFADRFPAATPDDLSAWDAFERERPQTFRAMYRLLLRRLSGDDPARIRV